MEKLAERKRSKNCKLSAEKDIGAENYVRRANFLEKLINCAIKSMLLDILLSLPLPGIALRNVMMTAKVMKKALGMNVK